AATLSWQAATDPDGDPVTYDVYFGTDATPATIVSAGQTDTAFDPTLVGNTTYYWKVVANDGSGGTSESEVWSFTTLNNPPGAVILEAPANTSTDVMAATLSWQAAIDPDGDPVTYDVYFGTGVTSTTIVSAGQTGTTFTPTSYANITYYWKIVAKDDKGGTSESEVWSFTTDIVQWSDTKRGTFYDSRDRKVYDVIKIGTQIWFAENLAYGAPGKQITNAITWQNNIAYDGWCYYNNDSRYAFSYGMLYQWELANDVCPAGWHLPSDAEWTTLIDNQRGGSVAGGYLKEAGTTHWLAPNTGANNSSKFTALPGGLRDPSGNFVNARSTGYWWSSSEATSPLTIRSRIMYNNSTQVNTTKANKNSGLSVRCIRD
ncbi:MAG: hypothetical protein MI975_12970, partial [Cytophagales bacterium]|nr:hypothetical protein [Cytophagales bacterium]